MSTEQERGAKEHDTEAVVFSNAASQWKGRYRDEAGNIQDFPLSTLDGEEARRLLAQHLGVRPMSVRIVHVRYKARPQPDN